MPFKTIESRRAYDKKYYENNPQLKQLKIQKAAERRVLLRLFVYEYRLAHPCVDCGESDPVVLDFDHQHDKIMDICKAIRNTWSLDKLKKEIEKCQVRCANCHRRKTAKSRM